MNKICGRCNLEKDTTLFSNKKSNRDGLQSNCKTCCGEEQKIFYTAPKNKLKKLEATREWRDLSSGKIKQRAISKRYKETPNEKAKNSAFIKAELATPEGRGKRNALTAKRRAMKLLATPKWLTAEQLLEIKSYYILAKELQWLNEEPLEVDHIIPLQGKEVSGLHVPWNLQILPESLNKSKGNRVI